MDELEKLYTKAQEAGEAHLEAVREHQRAMDEVEPDEWDSLPPDPSYGVTCEGPCDTCIVREVTHAVQPTLEEIFRYEQEHGIS